ncbi:hypothetical protein BDZ89DRAFT_370178 [Hymenopellis radicata]|nr:hypothetical protein BDZ89DRAFT_370178 [Hymenopellis radicata]
MASDIAMYLVSISRNLLDGLRPHPDRNARSSSVLSLPSHHSGRTRISSDLRWQMSIENMLREIMLHEYRNLSMVTGCRISVHELFLGFKRQSMRKTHLSLLLVDLESSLHLRIILFCDRLQLGARRTNGIDSPKAKPKRPIVAPTVASSRHPNVSDVRQDEYSFSGNRLRQTC